MYNRISFGIIFDKTVFNWTKYLVEKCFVNRHIKYLFAGICFHISYINHISADMSKINRISGYFVAELLQDGHGLKWRHKEEKQFSYDQ